MPHFDSTFDPPAATLRVNVHNPLRTKSKRSKGKLDTGADISVIPEDLVEELNLQPSGEEPVLGYDGSLSIKRKYFVYISFSGFSFFTDVLSSPRSNVLLGRDVLNQLRIFLSGKENIFTISDP